MKPIIVLDCGSQTTHLIASRVRRLGFAAEVKPAHSDLRDLWNAAGIILSGGPQSVYNADSPKLNRAVLLGLGIPILGICYGAQWLAQTLGGEVRQVAQSGQSGPVGEYGGVNINITAACVLFNSCDATLEAWMSHGDQVEVLPPDFISVASSTHCPHAAFMHATLPLFGVQFHPEVSHTQHGTELLLRFATLCNPSAWSLRTYLTEVSESLQQQVEDRSVFLFVSGGVDSTVALTILNRVLGPDRVAGVMIDTGLLRKDEAVRVRSMYLRQGVTNFSVYDAADRFFTALAGIVDPEEKREIIGRLFFELQEEIIQERSFSSTKWMLGQGTIYPDTIESGGTVHAAKIKTHHNRAPALEELLQAGRLVEPLKGLYKDEVRILGETELGLSREDLWQHPFPGPGLAVRLLCSKDSSDAPLERLPGLKEPHEVLPVRSVGVQGDMRTYRQAVLLYSDDLNTILPEKYWALAHELPNRHANINRVLVCVSHILPVPLVRNPAFITRERAELLRDAEAIVEEEVRGAGLYNAIWQFPVILLPCGRTERGQAVVLRPVDSENAMTAEVVRLPLHIIEKIVSRLLSLRGIDVVFYDLTRKPPATIEWE